MRDLGKLRREAEDMETLNVYRNMEGSSLFVHVHNARGLENLVSNEPSTAVQLKCEGQKLETQKVKDSFSPLWNETFTFKIERGDDPLEVKVFEKDIINRVTSVGTGFISLVDLRNQ